MIHLWEVIQAMEVKFFLDRYDHLGCQHTKCCPILRGSCAKLRSTGMELPKCYNTQFFRCGTELLKHKVACPSHFPICYALMCGKHLKGMYTQSSFTECK